MFGKAVDYVGALLLGRDDYRYHQFKRAKKIARRQGYEIYKSHLIWLTDAEFLKAREECERRGIHGIPNDRCYMLLESARLVRGVAGSFAECGVRYGKSSRFLLTGMAPGSAKDFHIFDSFEGLSEPGKDDLDEKGATVWEPGELNVPEDVVRRNLSGFGTSIELHKGWIPERFGDVDDERFSLVHIDVDLYEPTYDAVNFFYSRVSPGGVIICDDYGSAYCPGAKKAIDEFFADKPEAVIALPTGQSLVIKA
ncbi:MAG: TylF/MycF/NovP-related O-methyltransferase [Rhizobiaceae bacterium]